MLLVDDQELVRSGLTRILRRRDGFLVVGECEDGDQVVAAVEEYRPDVVVMDLRMRRMSGIDATAELAVSADTPPVLVLTTFDDDELLSGALRAGAAGFLLKDSPGRGRRARRRRRGRRPRAARPGRHGPGAGPVPGAPRTRCPPPPEAIEELTAREREVLELMGRGLSNGEIASTLVISEVTVKSHIGRIFTKLDLRDRAAAIVYAFDRGLVSPGG